MEKNKNEWFYFYCKSFSRLSLLADRGQENIEKINSLLVDIKRNGVLDGTGKPEKLKNRPGYSRRIDDANRLVYVLDELQNIKIISCKGHYED